MTDKRRSVSFDAAVTSLVLCTVPDVPAALGECRRVLRAGGELRFLEHVHASTSPCGEPVAGGRQHAVGRA